MPDQHGQGADRKHGDRRTATEAPGKGRESSPHPSARAGGQRRHLPFPDLTAFHHLKAAPPPSGERRRNTGGVPECQRGRRLVTPVRLRGAAAGRRPRLGTSRSDVHRGQRWSRTSPRTLKRAGVWCQSPLAAVEAFTGRGVRWAPQGPFVQRAVWTVTRAGDHRGSGDHVDTADEAVPAKMPGSVRRPRSGGAAAVGCGEYAHGGGHPPAWNDLPTPRPGAGPHHSRL